MPIPRTALLAACLAIAPLAACQSAQEPPLAGAQLGGPFELTSSKGQTVHWSDFDGKYRMVYFGYTYCPDVCPLDVQHMMQGYAQLKKDDPQLAARVQPMFISIDPERDTPAVMGEFTSAFSDDLMGLTGTPEQVAKAAKAFAVYYAKGKVSESGGYLMDHSRGAFLMGPKGEPIALLPVDQDGARVGAVLEQWVS